MQYFFVRANLRSIDGSDRSDTVSENDV